MGEIIFVDIDNTLWDFADVLYHKLIDKEYFVPYPIHWTWHFYKKYLDSEKFYDLVHQVHLDQELQKPFPDARDFLKWLKTKGFKVIIASNRKPDTKPLTERWLLNNHLDFDDLLIVPDKTDYIDNKVFLVIDDSPIVLQSALQKNVFATGLEYTWNRPLSLRVPLWRSLWECKNYIQMLM